jgi:NAD+ diphosphatase
MSRAFRFCPRCATPLQTTHEGGAERQRCPDPACGFVHWNNPVPVVAAIVEHEGKVILARNKLWPEKFFALITGFLEKNEQPEVAVLREVEEELGLKAHTPTLVGHYTFDQLNQLIIAYHVLAEGTVTLGEELADWRAIEPAKLRPWPAATGLALRDWMIARGYTPEVRAFSPLFQIRNFMPLGERFGTAGQPAAEQFGLVKREGFAHVVNLALPTSTGALPDEAEIVTALGLRYTHLPVLFESPQLEDLQRFFEVLDERPDEKVFVHCAMNMRVSAFMFLYRVIRQGVPRAEAEPALHRIWTPDAVWQDFIDRALRAHFG